MVSLEEPLITTELENALLMIAYDPDSTWGERASDPVTEERRLNERVSRRILDVFYGVSREFTHIDLGLVEGGDADHSTLGT